MITWYTKMTWNGMNDNGLTKKYRQKEGGTSV